jgi:hypothetical protein
MINDDNADLMQLNSQQLAADILVIFMLKSTQNNDTPKWIPTKYSKVTSDQKTNYIYCDLQLAFGITMVTNINIWKTNRLRFGWVGRLTNV